MNPPIKWNENYLLSMKTGKTQESLNLEFKSSRSLVNSDKSKMELSKDVSSFANSDGGDILYGVSEYGKPPSSFGDIDEGIDPIVTTPEWVEQVLNSNIHPRINGLKITPIDLKITRPTRYAYAIHIPASYDAPHQASDKRYYKRFNFQSIAMEDYEIRDIRNRQERTQLRIYCEISKARLTSISHLKTWPTFLLGFREGSVLVPSFNLIVWLTNTGTTAAKHEQVILSFDNLKIQKNDGSGIRIDDIRNGAPSLQWTSSEGIIYAKSKVKIMGLSLKVRDLNEFCTINTEVLTPDLPIVKHSYKFHNSMLILANFRDADKNLLLTSLDTLENMQHHQ